MRTDTTGGAAGLPDVPFRTATGRSRSTDRVWTPLLIYPCASTPAQGGWSWGGGRRSERLSGLRERRRDRACTTGVEASSLLQLVIPVRFWEGRSGIDKRFPAGDGGVEEEVGRPSSVDLAASRQGLLPGIATVPVWCRAGCWENARVGCGPNGSSRVSADHRRGAPSWPLIGAERAVARTVGGPGSWDDDEGA